MVESDPKEGVKQVVRSWLSMSDGVWDFLFAFPLAGSEEGAGVWEDVDLSKSSID